MSERPSPAIRLVIEIQDSCDPIEGALIEPAEHAAPFRGWLALTSLIEKVRGPRELVENAPV